MRDQRSEVRGQEERKQILDGINEIYRDVEERLMGSGHGEPVEVTVL